MPVGKQQTARQIKHYFATVEPRKVSQVLEKVLSLHGLLRCLVSLVYMVQNARRLLERGLGLNTGVDPKEVFGFQDGGKY